MVGEEKGGPIFDKLVTFRGGKIHSGRIKNNFEIEWDWVPGCIVYIL